MDNLIWKLEWLHFHDAELEAWVARSPRRDLLEREWETLQSTIAQETAVILRQPPAPHLELSVPDKELWKILGLGSFDSIRFAKAVFKSPDDEIFREGPDSLEAIILMLSKGFVCGEFRLVWVSPVELIFHWTDPNAKLTREQRSLLRRLNTRFFGCDARAVDYCPPRGFSIGLCV